MPVYQIKTGLTAFLPPLSGITFPKQVMASQLTRENAVDIYTQNQARLVRAQRLLDAARHWIGIRSEKTRLDRLLNLAERILRRAKSATVWPASKPGEGLLAAAGHGRPRSSLFGSLKRDDRDFWRKILVLLAFSAPDRREKPRNSMRTGYLAADFEQPERLNRAPECWKSFKMPNPGILPMFSVGRIALNGACNTSIAPGLRFRNHPKATASCSRQNSLNTYRLSSSGLMFILGY